MTAPKPLVPGALGLAMARVYTAEVARRNRAFDAGRGVVELDAPVISVGNLSVGGTGKTPMVMWVVQRLMGMGQRPVIAMRGYGAKRGGMSDEQAEYSARIPGIPVVAQPDRVAGLRAVRERFDCVVLDDGFQHRRIARDADIVLVDATRDVFADRCLPAGWLREPVASLARADAVVVTRCDLTAPSSVETIEARIRSHAPGALVARARHRWIGVEIDSEAEGSAATEDVEWLAGKSVVVACGIANPQALFAQVEGCGARIAARVAMRDHARWTDEDMARVRRAVAGGVDAVVVTMKDWVKVRGRTGAWGVPVARPVVDMDLGASEHAMCVLIAEAVGIDIADIMSA